MFRTRIIAGRSAGLVLAAAFAVVATIVHTADAFVEPLRVQPGRPAPVTLRIQGPEGAKLPSASRLVPRGARVTDANLTAAVERYESSRRPPNTWHLAGLWLAYLLIGAMTTTYLRTLSPGRGALLRTQLGLAALFALLLVSGKLFLLLTPFPPHALPVAAVPLWVSLYLDRRSAFAVSLTASLLAATLVGLDPNVLAVYFAASLTATLVFHDRKRPRTLLPAGLYAALLAAATHLATRTLLEGRFDLLQDLQAPWRSPLLASTAGGLLAGLVAYLFHPLAVLVLGAVSRSRLQDLLDLDQPLLRKMAREAPGSWEHARAMANLAEQAASAIGADALLTRVGAYYHDLGKTVQPKYFVENLEPGEPSPHEGLAPEVSADAIMAHVVEGTRILREGGIPEPVVEFAYTHHGTSVIEYFWHQCRQEGNPKGLSRSAFRYPGMKPRTRETGILMIVDAVEAASRTVDDPSRERFDELVRRIVWGKLRQGQLDDSGLTMADLHVVVERLVDTLCNAHHHRIKYPWQRARGGAAGRDEAPSPTETVESQGERAEGMHVPAPEAPHGDASATTSRIEERLPVGTLSDADIPPATEDAETAARLHPDPPSPGPSGPGV